MSSSKDRTRQGGRRAGEDDVLPYEGRPAPEPAPAQPVGAGRGSTAVGGRPGPSRPPTRPLRTEPRPTGGAARQPAGRRRARLALTRVDPWSVFVLSLLLAVFLGIVIVVAVAVLYALLDNLGVLQSLDDFAADLQVIEPGEQLVEGSRVLGTTAVLAAVYVVVLTVLATLGAVLYNLCSSVTGGVEVVLAERD